ncbi:MAG: endonuclease/exonuclease/phosphatase family protein, partial [Paracoccaceae bacterium]|nr:endonuclease/exonuclease/phosphatase family protein [Paracoccaceae bacterium]
MDLSRKGPGLLLRDLMRAEDDRLNAAVATMARAQPDVLVLTDIDYDHGLAALGVLQRALAAQGLELPHIFASKPNTGMPTGRDLDGDGLLGGPRDAQGYGWFSG